MEQEVLHVLAGDAAEHPEQAHDPAFGLGLELVEGEGVEPSPHRHGSVLPVDRDPAGERHVVRAAGVEFDRTRVAPHEASEEPSFALGLIAQSDVGHARSESRHRLAHDLHGVRVVQQHGTVVAHASELVGDRQHHGHRPQRHREPSRACGFLTDHAVVDRDLLVEVPRFEPARPEGGQDHVGAFQCGFAVEMRLDTDAGCAPGAHDGAREALLQVEGIAIEIVQHEHSVREGRGRVREGERDPRHVGGTTTDDDDPRSHAAHANSTAPQRPTTSAPGRSEHHHG